MREPYGEVIVNGSIPHKGATYPGQHKAIISKSTWSAVQSSLKENTVKRRAAHNVKSGCLLSGLVFDEVGEPLYTMQTSKDGRRHRYYVSKQIVREGRNAEGGLRIPAPQLESVVRQTVCDLLGNGIRVIEALNLWSASPSVQKRAMSKASEIAKELGINADFAGPSHDQFRRLLRRVVASDGHLLIELNFGELHAILLGQHAEVSARLDHVVTLTSQIILRRLGAETKLIVRAGE